MKIKPVNKKKLTKKTVEEVKTSKTRRKVTREEESFLEETSS
jgi:hypothetical protein